MTVYMDLENLLKEKNISKNKVCEACNLQRTQQIGRAACRERV